MKPDDIRREILINLYSRGNTTNGYYEKLGINKKIMDSSDSNSWSNNLWALNKLKKNADIADKLIKDYQLSGNDLNNEVAFEELRTNVNLVFKPKGFFSFLG